MSTTFALEGELTIYTAAEQKTRLFEALAKSPELEIDLSQVSELDSAGLQLMILLKREAVAGEKHLKFTMHSRPVIDVLELTNLSAYFGDQLVLTRHEGGAP